MSETEQLIQYWKERPEEPKKLPPAVTDGEN